MMVKKKKKKREINFEGKNGCKIPFGKYAVICMIKSSLFALKESFLTFFFDDFSLAAINGFCFHFLSSNIHPFPFIFNPSPGQRHQPKTHFKLNC